LWSADAYRTDSGYTGTLNGVVDTSGVSGPAPQAVYQSYAQANYGAGQALSYLLPVPDGAYTVRLHFAEPSYYYAGGRVFDVRLQGTTVRAGYDLFADAGALNKATALSFSVAATGGQGIKIELVSVNGTPALLSGIEVTAANPSGSTSPTADVDL